ncbi:MAG: hypothetical protein F6K31_22095 [Symploca sp. SIO2G7]|nr:hypothetical protein [Symploca sp. SIO2G7]
MLKQSNLITVACCLLPVASFHQPIFNLVQDLSFNHFEREISATEIASNGLKNESTFVQINSILVTCYLLLVTFYFLNCSHLTYSPKP